MSEIVMFAGFALAAYSVVGNDVIQTLGTFLTSNEKHMKWWVLWLFAASILTSALVYGQYGLDDIAYGRLNKFKEGLSELNYAWYYLLPPIVLLFITRVGVPVSTTFMILTLFSLDVGSKAVPDDLGAMMYSTIDFWNDKALLAGMIKKSFFGYVVAFSTGLLVYLGITNLIEKRFMDNELNKQQRKFWIVAQWFSTGFLWFQWLSQDLANIYIYLRGGADMSIGTFIFSLVILNGLLAYIFWSKGGAVQGIVRAKTNTADIRSATLVDLIYGLIMYTFKYDFLGIWGAELPMSTTWIFIGLLAGREIGMRVMLDKKLSKKVSMMIVRDFGKVVLGLVVSVILVFIIKLLS